MFLSCRWPVSVIASVWQIHLEINSLQNLPTFSPYFVALKLRLTHLSLENVDKDKVEFPADSVHLTHAHMCSAEIIKTYSKLILIRTLV